MMMMIGLGLGLGDCICGCAWWIRLDGWPVAWLGPAHRGTRGLGDAGCARGMDLVRGGETGSARILI
jgi:hypothetical protein